MRHLRLLALVTLISLAPSAAHADGAVQDIPPGEDVISPLKKGDPAPFDGQLFNNQTALRWANWLKQYQFKLKTDVELEQKKCSLDASAWQQKYQIQRDFYEQQLVLQIQDKRNLQSQLDNRPWYSSVWFGVAIGVVSTGLLVGGTAYALHAAK